MTWALAALAAVLCALLGCGLAWYVDEERAQRRHRQHHDALLDLDARRSLARTPGPRTLADGIDEARSHRPDDCGMLVVNLRRGIVIHSDGVLERILALPPGGTEGTAWRYLIEPGQLPQLARDLGRVDGDGTYRMRCADGSHYVPIYCSWSLDCERGVGVVYVRDATIVDAIERTRDARAKIDSWRMEPRCGA